MRIKINRLNKIYRQFATSDIAYFDLSRYNKKAHKFILWALKKIGLTPILGEEYLPSDSIELDDIIEQIYANKAVLENVLNREARYLFVGHDVMKRIGMRYIYGAIQLPMKIESNNKLLSSHIAGLKIIFLPYMTGMLVTPALDQSSVDQASMMFAPSVPDLELL